MNDTSSRALAARELVGSFPDYVGAQEAVDHLSDEKFPVEHTAIVGSDLRMIELVTGRLNYGRAALAGAGGGAWFGLLLGLFLSLFSVGTDAGLGLILWGLLFGTVAGLIFGLVGHAMSGGKRDFVSRQQIVAARYDVLVDSAHANQARALLEATRTTER
ncbi:hypothetical protein BH20ACT5_BH20ACT5_03320 [soil metagenome]